MNAFEQRVAEIAGPIKDYSLPAACKDFIPGLPAIPAAHSRFSCLISRLISCYLFLFIALHPGYACNVFDILPSTQ